MKTKEQLIKEYKDYQMKSDFVTSLEEFENFIDIGIDDVEEELAVIKKEKRENKRWQIDAKIRNFLFFIFEEEEVEFYDEDNKILEESRSLVNQYKDYFEKIKQLATEENFEKLVKLVDFSADYYNEHIDYLENKRDCLEYYYKGLNFVNNRYEDNRRVVDEFIQDKIDTIKKENVVKVKKI